MKGIAVVTKSLKEQLRSFWILLLSLSMGPLFIVIYYLVEESSRPQYRVLIINNDSGMVIDGQRINYGQLLTSFIGHPGADTLALPFKPELIKETSVGLDLVKNNKADALIIIHPSFSASLAKKGQAAQTVDLEFIGDLTKTGYLISAVWANEVINEFALQVTQTARLVRVKETPLGSSGKINEFDMFVPGILILSLIMLMFTASIAFVGEVEHKTILRLKMSAVTTAEFLGGITIVQVMVGIVSLLVTLGTALLLGFHYSGSLMIMIFIAALTSISIIAFSLIIAAVTKSATEVLVVGNFPMFLFMFFTGAAFPVKSEPWFTVAGISVNLQGLMTPTHAIAALNKTLIMDMGVLSVMPEIIAILVLSFIYFLTGAILFKKRHLGLKYQN